MGSEPIVKCKNCRGNGIKPGPRVCRMCKGIGLRVKRPQPGTRAAIARRYGRQR